MAHAHKAGLAGEPIKYAGRFVRPIQRDPADDAGDPIVGLRIVKKRGVFIRSVGRLDHNSTVNAGGVEMRLQIGRSEGSAERLEGRIPYIWRLLHPRSLVRAVAPKVLVRVDDGHIKASFYFRPTLFLAHIIHDASSRNCEVALRDGARSHERGKHTRAIC